MRTTDNTLRSRPPYRAAIALLAVWLAAGVGRAQTDDPMLFCMATPVRLATKDWAYVLWDVSAGAALPDEAFAVYARAGGFTSAGTFTRVTVAQRQRDPAAIAWLIDRAEAIGQTAADLSELIDTVFADLSLAPDLTLPQRLAAVVRAADENPEVADNLALLARRHAAIAMAVGRAAVVPIASSGASTIELRAYDVATGTSGTLRSRVGVTANSPTVLPAPVSLSDASTASPKGQLAIGLRWDVTDAYRRLSLLGFGFNVYRINRAYAEQKGYHLTPPAYTLLPSLLATQPNLVKRANRLPVLTDDEAPAGSPYFVDDNNRFEVGATPFADGEQFYYFVTACDVLGRDGTVSAGLLLTARDRFAPLPPVGMRARRLRLYDTAARARDFGVEVSWKPNPQTSNDVTSVYYVYRYTNQTDVTFRSTNTTLNRIGGPITQNTNVTRLAFIDTGVGEADIGRSRYYTVRAVKYAAACTNWSGHSAPVACNLRDEDGPGIPQATLMADRLDVGLYAGAATATVGEGPLDRGDFLLVCNLSNYLARSAIRYIEFHGRETASNGVTPYLLGRYPVDARATAVTSRLVRGEVKQNWSFWCKARLKDGRESNEAAKENVGAPAAPLTYKVVFFGATGAVTRVPVADGARHYTPPAEYPPPVGVTVPTNGPPGVYLHLDGDAYEWRLYTQLGDGALTLAKQGLGEPGNDVTNICSDVTRYLYDTWVKYYIQTLDNNGNPSPLRLLGRCLIPGAVTLPPVNQIYVTPSGKVDNPTLTVGWTVSSHGVDHFDLYIGMINNQPPETWGNSGLSENLAGYEGLVVRLPPTGEASDLLYVGRYATPRLGAGFGAPGTNAFSVTLPVELNRRYFVHIEALSGPSEGTSDLTTWTEGRWTTPVPPSQVEVPWPERPLPEVRDMGGSTIRPVFIPQYTNGIPRNAAAVVIGRVDNTLGAQHTVDGYLLPTGDAVSSYLYWLAEGTDPLLPFVLYRRQVANARFPSVSGQFVQATPLLEEFASQLKTNYAPPRRLVLDPYLIIGKLSLGSTADYDDICVRDRLGIVGGAAYEYYLVRFGSDREPRDVLKLGSVTIPEKPPK